MAKLCMYEQTFGNFLSETSIPVDSSSTLNEPAFFSPVSIYRSGNAVYMGGAASHLDFHQAYFSKISLAPLAIKTNNGLENRLSIYPNPCKGKFAIIYQCQGQNQLNMRVSDGKGCCVYAESFTTENGDLTREIALEQLTGGFYIIEVKDEKGAVIRKKLVIQ